MASVAALSRNVLVLGCVALFAQMPAFAQSAPKLSKPLNLTEFAKAPQAARPRPAAKVASPAARPQPEQALTTASIAKNGAASTPPSGDTASTGPAESDVARFCTNITDAALDARVAWQQKELESAEAKLRLRIAELEAKRAEYEQWLKLREDFLKKAEDSVVEIYSGMNPEAAAQQIASMADDTAAAVLAKLRVRSASAILNEMEPARGAHLADTLAGMRRADDGKTKK
jgi:flagellar motility protein MotE (MotC chaperone)